MAEAVGPDGRVDTIESVAEHADLAEAELAVPRPRRSRERAKRPGVGCPADARRPLRCHLPRWRLVGVPSNAARPGPPDLGRRHSGQRQSLLAVLRLGTGHARRRRRQALSHRPRGRPAIRELHLPRQMAGLELPHLTRNRGMIRTQPATARAMTERRAYVLSS